MKKACFRWAGAKIWTDVLHCLVALGLFVQFGSLGCSTPIWSNLNLSDLFYNSFYFILDITKNDSRFKVSYKLITLKDSQSECQFTQKMIPIHLSTMPHEWIVNLPLSCKLWHIRSMIYIYIYYIIFTGYNEMALFYLPFNHRTLECNLKV